MSAESELPPDVSAALEHIGGALDWEGMAKGQRRYLELAEQLPGTGTPEEKVAAFLVLDLRFKPDDIAKLTQRQIVFYMRAFLERFRHCGSAPPSFPPRAL